MRRARRLGNVSPGRLQNTRSELASDMTGVPTRSSFEDLLLGMLASCVFSTRRYLFHAPSNMLYVCRRLSAQRHQRNFCTNTLLFQIIFAQLEKNRRAAVR